MNQYIGDGIMALFGAPIAHEDHAQRADFAALHLTDELRRYAEELKRTRGIAFADEATRQRELREARRLFHEMGATPRAEQVAR